MTDDRPTHQERLRGILNSERPAVPSQNTDGDADEADASCAAFGYLRGIRDQAASLELRFKNGNSMWFPYNWLGTWQYNPSEGLLLKYSGDLVYLVLIRGSNLDALVGDKAINLTDRGFQRHRILWVREMEEGELQQIAQSGPTVDRIEAAENATCPTLIWACCEFPGNGIFSVDARSFLALVDLRGPHLLAS